MEAHSPVYLQQLLLVCSCDLQAMKPITYFNWSTGKDSALALYYLLQEDKYAINTLLTTVNSHFNRVSMHGLHTSLMELQAKAIGIPLDVISLPQQPSMEVYAEIMTKKVNELKNLGYTHCAFGDIFLEDLKTYRENQLKPLGIETLFPLWKKDTTKLIHDFLSLGFKAKIISINNTLLGTEFLGEDLSLDLINALPKNVDPCGENGEFHTFCYDGPIFSNPVQFKKGEIVLKTYDNPQNKSEKITYGFCDLVATV